MLTEQPWTEENGTIEDVRRIFCDFCDEADRKKPEYFPDDKPAEKQYDTGRMKWQRDIRGGRIMFESEPDATTADFDREEWEVFDYGKRLDKRSMSDKSGTDVYIGAPEEFAEWVGYSVEELLAAPAETGGSLCSAEGADENGDSSQDDGKDSSGILARPPRR